MEFEVIENDLRRFKCSVRHLHETVYNQMEEPICYACAVSSAITITYRVKYGFLLDFSPQSMVNNRVYNFKSAKKHLVDEGLQEHCDDPFIHIRRKPYLLGLKYNVEDYKLIRKLEEKKEALKFNFGPWGPKYALVADVKMHDGLTRKRALAAWKGEPFGLGWEKDDDDSEEDLDSEEEDEEVAPSSDGHGVVITGLDTTSLYEDQHAIEMKNSWGRDWGFEGYTRITYDLIDSLEIPVMKGDVDVEDMKEVMKKRRHQLHLNTFIGGKPNTVKVSHSKKENSNDDWSKGEDSIEFKCFSYEHFLDDSRNEDVDTIERHPVLINGICFSDDGKLLAAACEDGAVWRFHLEEASRNRFKCRRLTMPKEYGYHRPAVAVTFADSDSSLVVACRSDATRETYLNTYCTKDTSNGGDALLQFQYKNESRESHHPSDSVGLYGSKADSADGSTMLVTSSGGTDVWGQTETPREKLPWAVRLKYPHAIISPDGRYIAAATTEHAVKIWEIKPEKYGGKRVEELKLFEGHKHAVKGMCFTPDKKIITSSLDGTLRVWNIEGPDAHGKEAWMAFPPPRHNSKELQVHYDCVSMSPDGDILAVSQGKVLQWISFNNRKVLDTAEHAHEGNIRSITWAPKPISVGGRKVNVLATLDDGKKMKLWKAPDLPTSLPILNLLENATTSL